MNFNPAIAVPIIVFVASPLVFGLVLTLIARIGGWSELAKVYRTTEPFPRPRLWMRSAQLRASCNYGSCLTFAADAESLYVRPMFPFGFGHPSLKLPWAEATAAHSTEMFLFKRTSFTFERVPGVPIRLPKTTADRLVAIAAASRGASLPMEGEESNGD